MNEYSYDSVLAGIRSSVSSTAYGIDISVSGYHEKLPAFLKVIVQNLANYKLDPERFPLIKDQFKRKLENFKASQPIQLAAHGVRTILCQRTYTHAELLDALERVLWFEDIVIPSTILTCIVYTHTYPHPLCLSSYNFMLVHVLYLNIPFSSQSISECRLMYNRLY